MTPRRAAAIALTTYALAATLDAARSRHALRRQDRLIDHALNLADAGALRTGVDALVYLVDRDRDPPPEPAALRPRTDRRGPP